MLHLLTAIHADRDLKKEHLERGVLPEVENWHAKHTLIKVSTAYSNFLKAI